MSNVANLTEIDILSDAISPDEGDMSASAAESVLRWKFSDKAIQMMNELAKKNREGVLTDPEQRALDNFMRVGDLLDLIQAKARVSLMKSNPNAL